MLANVFSDPFWLKVTKGLLLSSLSSSMRCFTLPCSGPVVYSFHASKCATSSEFHTIVNFTKSEICLPNAFLPCLFEPVNDELAVAQCSSFVKHHVWIPVMYFDAMFGCCSMSILLHLYGYLLIIADRCHI